MMDGIRMPKSPFAGAGALIKHYQKEFGKMTPRSLLEGSRSSSPCIVRPASLDQSQTFRLSTTPESMPRFEMEGLFSDSEAASSRRSSSSPQQFVLSPTKSDSMSES